MKTHTALLFPDSEERGYTVTVPALPGCTTEGDTMDEALEHARDAIAPYLEDMEADGEPIPVEHEPPELRTISLTG